MRTAVWSNKMKLGFIGAGNMAYAMMKSIIDKNVLSSSNIIVSDISDDLLENRKNELNVNITKDNQEIINFADVVILAIKPQVIGLVLEGIKEHVNNQIIVSIAAGIKIEHMKKILGDKKIVRVMPNTPCLVGEMAAGYSYINLNEEELDLIKNILDANGVANQLDESLLDAVTGLSGSGPAFVARFIEAFIEAGVENGLSKDIAYKLSLQTFLGTAKLLLEKDLSPEQLVEMVSSPNGTTVAGREVLESSNYKEIVKKTITNAVERSKELGK